MRYRSRIFDPINANELTKVSFCLELNNCDEDTLGRIKKNLETNWSDRNTVEFLIRTAESNFDKLKSQFDDYLTTGFLKVFDYSLPKEPSGNLLAQTAKGEVLFFYSAQDTLAPRLGTYLYQEMTKSDAESFVIMEKKFRQIVRLGVWRNTFYEVGGFNPDTPPTKRGIELAKRLRKIGCTKVFYAHFNHTESTTRRSFQFSAPSPKTKQLSLTPLLASHLQWLK